MKTEHQGRRLRPLSTTAFLAVYMVVLARAGISSALLSQVDPLEILCPLMLTLAGALLERVTLGVVLALSLAQVSLLHAAGHLPLTDTLALGAIYCASLASGAALRRWRADSSRTVVVGTEREVEVLGTRRRRAGLRKATSTPPAAAANPKLALLSRRERDVAQLAIRGFRSGQIGEQLFISERTVETHLGSIYGKLHVHSRREMIAQLTPASGAGTAPNPRHRFLRIAD
jgi:DNA-binding CsgD family transcriptional regulator